MLKVKLLLLLLTLFVSVFSNELSKQLPSAQLQNVVFHSYQRMFNSQLNLLAANLTRSDRDEQVCVLNEYVDDLLKNVDAYIMDNYLDPIDIPGFDASFKWTFFNGWIRLQYGTLGGLSTIKRTADVVIKYDYPNVKIHIPLGFSNLAFHYFYELKFMQLGPDGTGEGKSEGNKFSVDMDFNMVNLRMKLEEFRLQTLGSVSLKFSGTILIDWIINLVVSVILPILNPILSRVIEGYVVDGMQTIITTCNSAVCHILDDCQPTDLYQRMITNFIKV